MNIDRILRHIGKETDRLARIKVAIEAHYQADSPAFAELLSMVVRNVAAEIEAAPSPHLRAEVQIVAAKLGMVTAHTSGYYLLRGCRPISMTTEDAIAHARKLREAGKHRKAPA